MAKIKPHNPPAFPRPASRGDNYVTCKEDIVIDLPRDMTPRDYLAAHALCGLLANSHSGLAELEAKEAYRLADKMLEERSRQE